MRRAALALVALFALHCSGTQGPPPEPPSAPAPTVELCPSGLRQVAFGADHACLLCGDGSVRCWGDGGHGQLGVGSEARNDGRPRALTRVALPPARALALGTWHSCALTTNQQVLCWGENARGEVGDGTTLLRDTPVLVRDLEHVVQLSSLAGHTCAVRDDGRVFCWGQNHRGQLGDGTRVDRSTPGEARALLDAAEVAVGRYFTCARTTHGAVHCWGDNSEGQLGDPSLERRLRDRGDEPVLRARPSEVPNVTGATALASGPEQVCALGPSGAACWGSNSHGQLGERTADEEDGRVARLAGVPALAALRLTAHGAWGVSRAGALLRWGRPHSQEPRGPGAGSVQPARATEPSRWGGRSFLERDCAELPGGHGVCAAERGPSSGSN